MFGWLKEGLYLLRFFFLDLSSVLSTSRSVGQFDPKKNNIVLVYGFVSVPEALFPLKSRLESLGYNVLIPDLGWAMDGIDSFTKKLVGFLTYQEKLLRERSGKTLFDIRSNVILFGHSMGGLIILSAQRLFRELLEFQVITAGTPLGGTPIAYYFAPWSSAAQQMSPGSKWLKELREDMRIYRRKLLQVSAEEDELVPRSSVLNEYPSHIADFVGHAALIFALEPDIFRRLINKTNNKKNS